jgi:hypothetical protein
VLPVRADERLRYQRTGPFDVAKRLPCIGILDGGRIESVAQIHRCIRRDEARVIGIRRRRSAPRLVAELIRAVAVARLEHGACGKISDPGRGRGIRRPVARVVSELRHERVEDGFPADGEEIDGSEIRGVADRRALVRERSLRRPHPERPAETRAEGDAVMRRPRVVHARVRDGERTRDHRWPELRHAHGCEQRVVPLDHDTVAVCHAPQQRGRGFRRLRQEQSTSRGGGEKLASGHRLCH